MSQLRKRNEAARRMRYIAGRLNLGGDVRQALRDLIAKAYEQCKDVEPYHERHVRAAELYYAIDGDPQTFKKIGQTLGVCPSGARKLARYGLVILGKVCRGIPIQKPRRDNRPLPLALCFSADDQSGYSDSVGTAPVSWKLCTRSNKFRLKCRLESFCGERCSERMCFARSAARAGLCGTKTGTGVLPAAEGSRSSRIPGSQTSSFRSRRGGCSSGAGRYENPSCRPWSSRICLNERYAAGMPPFVSICPKKSIFSSVSCRWTRHISRTQLS